MLPLPISPMHYIKLNNPDPRNPIPFGEDFDALILPGQIVIRKTGEEITRTSHNPESPDKTISLGNGQSLQILGLSKKELGMLDAFSKDNSVEMDLIPQDTPDGFLVQITDKDSGTERESITYEDEGQAQAFIDLAIESLNACV